MGFFNKTSVGFIVRFVLILLVSFAILFAINSYILNSKESQTTQSSELVGQ